MLSLSLALEAEIASGLASWGSDGGIIRHTLRHDGSFSLRRGARVVEWDGLENRCGPCGHRGFESHPLRCPRAGLIGAALLPFFTVGYPLPI